MNNKNNPTNYIAWRYDIDPYAVHYVSSLPCKEYPGALKKGDFGYSVKSCDAISLSAWWFRRWKSQMEKCGIKPFFKEAVLAAATKSEGK